MSQDVTHASTTRGRKVGTVHKSLRIESSVMKRIENLTAEGESTSKAVNRVLAAGCDVLESNTGCNTESNTNVGVFTRANTEANTGEHASTNGAQMEHGASTQRLIEYLEREIERLEAEHEADREAIIQKDEQIAQALEKAQELTEQAHVLMGMQTKTEILPAPASSPLEDEPQAGQEEPKSWWQRWFG